MEMRIYIISRMRHFSRTAFQLGYVTPEEIVFGLRELAATAEHFGLFDLADSIKKKSNRLLELLPKQGTPAFSEFAAAL